MVEFICIECGKAFLSYECRRRVGKAKYCSKICACEALKKREPKPRAKRKSFVCKSCNKEFVDLEAFDRKYCSDECYHISLRGKNAGVESPWWRGGFPKCPVCGKILASYIAKHCPKHKIMTEETKKKISDRKVGKMPKNLSYKKCFRNSIKGHFDINGKSIFFRSKWEANYALYLDFLLKNGEIKSWEYEADRFIFYEIERGTRSYLPDFKIYNNNGTTTYHEVKGWMDEQSKTKLKRMAKYYPDITIKLIQQKQYSEIKNKVGKILKFY